MLRHHQCVPRATAIPESPRFIRKLPKDITLPIIDRSFPAIQIEGVHATIHRWDKSPRCIALAAKYELAKPWRSLKLSELRQRLNGDSHAQAYIGIWCQDVPERNKDRCIFGRTYPISCHAGERAAIRMTFPSVTFVTFTQEHPHLPRTGSSTAGSARGLGHANLSLRTAAQRAAARCRCGIQANHRFGRANGKICAGLQGGGLYIPCTASGGTFQASGRREAPGRTGHVSLPARGRKRLCVRILVPQPP